MSQAAQRRMPPASTAAPHSGQAHAASARRMSRVAFASRPCRTSVNAEASSSGSTPESAPMRTPRRWTATALRARASFSTRSTIAETSEYSCMQRLR